LILQYEHSDKRFKLEFQNLKYLQVFFSLDGTFTDHIKLFNDDCIEAEVGYSICNKIMTMLQNNIIYEYHDDLGHLLPIIVLPEYQLAVKHRTIGKSLFPISSCSVNFLMEFSSFLDSCQRILIDVGLKRNTETIENHDNHNE